ncbi:unnamed protein product [Onchocerca ochengi]|uniref:Fork-head domain-containing protein n=1 Tax=Onchocerca ochengi TaxID=42157 RepID=A0A182ENP3_ONCOC|nr:unnamed protein product [Onchocerca ochengi]
MYRDDLIREDKEQITAEQVICNNSTDKRLVNKCSLLCWIYRVLATSSERQLSLNDIYHRFLSLNPNWEKLLPNWKFSVGETLLTSKCFICKDSLWSINADFALKHERAAVAQGLSHRCPPSISSTCEIIDASRKNVLGLLKKFFKAFFTMPEIVAIVDVYLFHFSYNIAILDFPVTY